MTVGPKFIRIQYRGYDMEINNEWMSLMSLRIHCFVTGIVFCIFPAVGYYIDGLKRVFVWGYPDENKDYENIVITFMATQAVFLLVVAFTCLQKGKLYLQFFIVSTASQSLLRLILAHKEKNHLEGHGDVWQMLIACVLTVVFYTLYFYPKLL